MVRRPGRQLIVLWMAFLAGWAVAARAAAEPQVTLDPAVAHPGDLIELRIQMEQSFSMPEPPGIEGDAVVLANRNPRFQQFRHKSQDRIEAGVAFIYTLQARKPGEYRILPIRVRVGQQVIETQSVSGEVRELPSIDRLNLGRIGYPETTDNGIRSSFFTVVRASETEPVTGEAIALTTYFYQRAGQNLPRVSLNVGDPEISQQFYEVEESSEIPNSLRVTGKVEIEGQTYQISPIHRVIVVPAYAGEGRVSGVASVLSQTPQRFSVFPDQLRIGISAPEIGINVKPLPDPPDDVVAQLVGDFTVGLSADRDELNEGDLLTLEVRISGRGDLEMIGLDNFPDIDGLSLVAEEVESTTNQPAPELVSTKTFKRIYQPSRPGSITVPALRFAVYRPTEDRQIVTETKQVSVNVLSSTKSSLQVTDPSMTRNRAEARELGETGLLYIDTRPLSGRVWRSSRTVLSRQPVFWIFHGALLFAVGLFGGWHAWRRRLDSDVDSRRARAARQRAQAALKDARAKVDAGEPGEFYAALSAGIMNQAGSVLGREASGLTIEDAVEEFRRKGADDALTAELRRLLERCDAMRFAPSGEAANRGEDLRAAGELAEALARVGGKA